MPWPDGTWYLRIEDEPVPRSPGGPPTARLQSCSGTQSLTKSGLPETTIWHARSNQCPSDLPEQPSTERETTARANAASSTTWQRDKTTRDPETCDRLRACGPHPSPSADNAPRRRSVSRSPSRSCRGQHIRAQTEGMPWTPLERLGGQPLVKEPTELGGTRRYSCDIRNHLQPAKLLVRALPEPSLTRNSSRCSGASAVSHNACTADARKRCARPLPESQTPCARPLTG
jgi:hypothetical protein